MAIYLERCILQTLLYFLIFIFGYVTCKTFYFMRSARLSLKTVRVSHLIYLSAMMKSIENLATSRELMLEYLLKTEKSSNTITSFTLAFDKNVEHIKENSIKVLVDVHPKFFKEYIDFDDWDSSMKYLTKHQKAAFEFWRTL